MKKYLASVSLLAAGASVLQAQYASELSPQEQSKPWALSAALRGFYDDNYTTTPQKVSTFGLEASPSFSVNHTTDQTYAGAGYIYDFKYYANGGATDNAQQINLKYGHRINERYSFQASDFFVVGQDVQLLNDTLTHTPVRIPGQNIRNDGTIGFTAQLTELLDVGLNYDNTMYAFAQHGPASTSAINDRFEQSPQVNLRYHVLEDTTVSLNYMFQAVQYTSPYSIIGNGFVGIPINGAPAITNVFIPSSSRNAHNNIFYAGVDQTFTPQLNGSVRAGAQYNNYYRVDEIEGLSNDSTVSFYADAKLSYAYQPDSNVAIGLRHAHNATDIVGFTPIPNTVAVLLEQPVLDAESTAVYGTITHQITPKLAGNALLQYQYSTFNGGGPGTSGQVQNFYIFDVNLAYQFTPFLLAEAGYAFDDLNTTTPEQPGYSRNRVYLGIRATY